MQKSQGNAGHARPAEAGAGCGDALIPAFCTVAMAAQRDSV
jgi:hypothetical protein